MDKQKLIDRQLIEQHIAGTLTGADALYFQAWYEADEAHRNYYEDIKQLLEDQYPLTEVSDHQQRQAWASLSVELQSETITRSLPILLLKYAAAVALIFTIGYLSYYLSEQNLMAEQPAVIANNMTIQPGANRATLTLADGRTLALSEQKQGIVVTKDQIAYDDGTPIERQAVSHKSQIPQPLNTIETPRGGQYQLTLPDGTKVFLNAETQLHYLPVEAWAKTNTRQVTLIGEAYFDVAQDPTKPFIINGADLTTTVLGTTFNIKAYPEEEVQVTLQTGKVKVETSIQQHNNTATLQPNQQITYDKNTRELISREVDPYTYISWKHGRFVFEEQPLGDIMIKMQRWYNFEVVWENQTAENRVFTGDIYRLDKFEKVLELLATAGDVRFEVNGNEVRVK